MSIKVLLVDDHKLMCEGLHALLAGRSDIVIVGEANDGMSALNLVRDLAPDVVLMDVEMPDMNGVEATLRIRSKHERVKVIALSMHTDRRFVHRMLDAGASGYLLKMAAHDELLRAVRAVHRGKVYLSPEIAGCVVERSASPNAGGEVSVYSKLTAREREVLKLIAEGKTSAEAAKQLHISIKTVETHRRNISTKLALHGTANLTKYAIREGLTSLES